MGERREATPKWYEEIGVVNTIQNMLITMVLNMEFINVETCLSVFSFTTECSLPTYGKENKTPKVETQDN